MVVKKAVTMVLVEHMKFIEPKEMRCINKGITGKQWRATRWYVSVWWWHDDNDYDDGNN